jgi:hypothetical protein
MSNRFVLPLETPVDSTGAPYPGGQLFFYASGTSTKLNTYSDPDLAPAHANTNPVVLDSAGRFPNAIFLQNLQYSVVLAPSTDTDPPTSPIWTQDPVYTSDYSAQAKFKSGSGSPNGVVAGTAGSATINADSYWDYTNNILYICTTTGTTSTAVWTAINAATSANVVPAPQGRLTLTSGTPVINGDVTAATAVYYTPYVGDDVPIYNGTSFIPQSIVSELQLTLTSSHVASNIYDLFIFNNSGVVTLGSGPSWSAGTSGSITAGSCARGTGVGGAALTRIQGILTNAVSMTIRYGNGTVTATVAANQATYVGSMFMDGTNGQVTCNVSWGSSRKYGIWNAYNRVPIILKAGDASGGSDTSTIFHALLGNTANSLTTLTGLAEEYVALAAVDVIVQTGSDNETIAIGVNSTSVATGLNSIFNSGASGLKNTIRAEYDMAPSLGINTITSLFKTSGGAPTIVAAEAGNILSSRYRA